jgi:general secretion pathway protein C
VLTLPLPQADVIRVLQSRRTRLFIRVLNVLLVIWIASLFADLTWDMLTPEEQVEPAVVVQANSPVQATEDQQIINQLPGWHLMGVVARGSAPVQTSVPVDAPETSLKLILRGVFSSDDKINARAIIADPNGKEDQYAVGDKLPGNAELSEVHPNKVILKRGGRYETLRMPRDNKSTGVVTRKSTQPQRTVRQRTAPQRSSMSPRERLKNAREDLRNRPRNVQNLVKVTPKRNEQGQINGYELGPGSDPELFEQVGLQQGDVAIQINGITLDNPAESARALKILQTGDEVSLTVLRNGQETVLNLSAP